MVDGEKEKDGGGRRDRRRRGDVRGLGRLLGTELAGPRRGFKGVLDVSREGWRGN